MKSKRILELDSLRALAAINLLLFHFTWVYQAKYGFSNPLGFTFPYGKYGVELFFILSGFVNAMTLVRRRPARDFAVGRMIRILPSFWAVVILNVWLLTLVPMFNAPVSGAETLANLTVMPGLFGYGCMEPVTWTLQVEMLFYGFLLILLLTGLIDKLLPTLMTCMAFCVAGSFIISEINRGWPDSPASELALWIEHFLILRHLPLFAMGMLLHEIKAKRGKLWANGMGILTAAIVFHLIDQRDHNPLATGLLFGLLAFSAYGKVPMLRCRPLVFISTISYSLYLFHNNLGSGLIRQLDLWGISPLACMLIATSFSVVIATAITYWFERPVTAYLRARWTCWKERQVKSQIAEAPPSIVGISSGSNQSTA